MKGPLNDLKDINNDIKILKTKETSENSFKENRNDSKNESALDKDKLVDLLEKYGFKDGKFNKGMEIFYRCFEHNIATQDIERSVSTSKEIVDYIGKIHPTIFPKMIRSKSHNLKENVKLCEKVYSGDISLEDFVKMSHHDMQSDDLRTKDKASIHNSLLEAQIAKPIADTDMFQCGKCKERKCTYYQLQTRSCDEPMTTFVTCTQCGNKWKF